MRHARAPAPGSRGGTGGDHHYRAWSEQARRDAMKHMAKDLPEPKQYAWEAPALVVQLLRTAWRGSDGYRVTEDVAKVLRPLGLCEYGGTFLTVYGSQVRKFVVAEEL